MMEQTKTLCKSVRCGHLLRWTVGLGAWVITANGCNPNSPANPTPEPSLRVSHVEAHHPSSPPDCGPVADSHLLILVQSAPSGFSVLRTQTVTGRFPKPRGMGGPSAWSYRALSAHGEVLVADSMTDPHVVSGAFVDPASGETHGAPFVRNDSATFSVRVPKDAKTIQFFQGLAAFATAGRGSGAQALGSVTVPH